MLLYSLRRSARHRAVRAQSTVRSSMLCVALPGSALCKRRRQRSPMLCTASLCQTPRCACAVDSALFYALRRSARHRAVRAQSTVRSSMLCVALPDSALCKRRRQRSTMLCTASLCQTPRCASAVDIALCYALRRSARHRAVRAQSIGRSAMLCSASPCQCQTACYSGEVGRVLCYALRSFVRVRAALAQMTPTCLICLTAALPESLCLQA